MESKRSKENDPSPITLEALSADVKRRRAALGDAINMPRNNGDRRTASKRALLQAIKNVGGNW